MKKKIIEYAPNLDMNFKQVEVSKIRLAKYNPRKDLKPADPEYQSLKQAILTHGLVDPLILNDVNNVLVGGHQRLKILRDEFKAKKVWCSIVHKEKEDEEAALNISLNNNQGAWDFPKLKALLERFSDLPTTDALRASLGFNPTQFDDILKWKDKFTDVGKIDLTPQDMQASYEEGAIKQIVLYFEGKDQYPKVIKRLDAVLADAKVDDFTSAFLFLLDSYENTHSTTKAD